CTPRSTFRAATAAWRACADSSKGSSRSSPAAAIPPASPSTRRMPTSGWRPGRISLKPVPPDRKVAIVTGAARGIGLAVARKFIELGYRVSLLDIDFPALSAASAKLENGKVLAIECDVANPAQVKDAVGKTVAKFGRIDALVNNAGIALFKPACAPVMLENGGGAVVNVASISGMRASTLRIAYGTSKAALMHLTKQQAAELGNVGVRVNCVAPGPVDT